LPRQLQAKVNPFSRFAGDLPVLAPAGRSTKIDQVYRRSITVDQGKRALVVLTNVGQGQNHGLVYQWKSDDTNSFDVSHISFNMLPTDTGSCTEMRASKSSLIIRNNTTPLHRAKYAYALVGANRPEVNNPPSTASSKVQNLNGIYDQIYGRRETQSYDYDKPRELINAMADFVDYHEYRSPANLTILQLEELVFHKDGLPGADLPMTVAYFIVPPSNFDQVLDIESYACCRCRYELTDPLSRFGTVQAPASGRVKQSIEKAATSINEGLQPPAATVGGQGP
jgi:hypothetical protein